MAEVPFAVGVVNRRGHLVCVDPDEHPLAAVVREEVLAYTLNPDVAQDMVKSGPVRTLAPGTGLAAAIA